MANADGRVGLANLGPVEAIGGDVGAPLDQRVDALVEPRHWDHAHVLPRETGARQLAEDVVPAGEIGRIFARQALSLHVVDRLDRRVAAHDGGDHQGRAAHHQPQPGRVRERIAPPDLVGGAVEGETDVDGVVHAQLELAGLQHRQERAGARIGLHGELGRAGVGRHLGDGAADDVENAARRIGADVRRRLRGGHRSEEQHERRNQSEGSHRGDPIIAPPARSIERAPRARRRSCPSCCRAACSGARRCARGSFRCEPGCSPAYRT